MPYTFTLTATIPASPLEIYEAWLDSVGHSEMTGGEATMSDEVGAEVTAWDGYISGRNVELVLGERIVQSWRTSEFGDEDADSIITVVLQQIGEGTLLTLEHSNVPDAHQSYEEGGWQSNYFEPMVAYFSEIKADIAEPAPYQTPAKTAPKRAAKPPAKSGGKKPPATRKPPAKRLPPKKAPVEPGEPRAREEQNGQRRPRKQRRRRSKVKTRRGLPPQQRRSAPSRPHGEPLAAKGDKS